MLKRVVAYCTLQIALAFILAISIYLAFPAILYPRNIGGLRRPDYTDALVVIAMEQNKEYERGLYQEIEGILRWARRHKNDNR